MASFIAGTVMVGSVVLIGTAVRSADVTSKSADLLQLIQTQIELIQHAPYAPDGVYPLLTDLPEVTLPEGVTISYETSDTGTNYHLPGAAGSFITNVVQRIDVTATAKGGDTTSLSFYKITGP